MAIVDAMITLLHKNFAIHNQIRDWCKPQILRTSGLEYRIAGKFREFREETGVRESFIREHSMT